MAASFGKYIEEEAFQEFKEDITERFDEYLALNDAEAYIDELIDQKIEEYNEQVITIMNEKNEQILKD